MSKNFLIIGGLGHWSQKHYVPLLSKNKICENLIICDIKNKQEASSDYIYIKLPKENQIIFIKNVINKYSIDIVIVSTPPVYHDFYLTNLIPTGVNFICDKPLVAIKGQSYDKKQVLKIKEKYNEILELKNKYKVLIYTPLRRHVQNFYHNIYDSVKMISKNYNQNITFASLYENDGVYRWDNEMNIDFAHGYNNGLGKVTQTGYHILDIVAKLIESGCQNINSIKCQILNVHNVGDNENSKSVKNLKKLLDVDSTDSLNNELVKSAELDITIKIAVTYYDDADSNFYIHLRHSGVTNRVVKQYNIENPGDQGRTDDSQFIIEQGPMQNIYSIVFANDTISEEKKSMTFMKRHIKVAEQLGLKSEEIIDLDFKNEIGTEEIMINLIYAMLGNKNFQKEYEELEFSNQRFTMELYYAVLLAKVTGKIIEWKKGELI